MHLNGIHHVTAVSSAISDNIEFYTHVLGLRLVKKSVNQDDVSAYHLFYGDANGTPGTDMTFFDWPKIANHQPGTDSIMGTAFRVANPEALKFWATRLQEKGVKVRREKFSGVDLLAFEDPEGQRLFLVDDHDVEFEGQIWATHDIPENFAIRGFYSAILSVPDMEEFASLLGDALGFTFIKESLWIDKSTKAWIFQTHPEGGPGSEIWLLEEPQTPQAKLGAGGVHHVAFRVQDEEQSRAWRKRLIEAGFHVSNIIDRFWFRSIYFRLSEGILFEIATDGPGFAIDEEPDALGQTLVLPPFLESQREKIEAGLNPLMHAIP